MKDLLLRKKLLFFYLLLSGGFLISFHAEATRNASAGIFEDCACEGGIPFLTVQYKGQDGATINVYAGNKSKSLVTTFINVSDGDLLQVDGSKFMHGVFKTRRYFQVAGSNIAEVMFHTSCSENILGQTKGNFTVTSYTDKKGNSCSLNIDNENGSSSDDASSGNTDDSNDSVNVPVDDNSDYDSSNGCNASAMVKNVTCFAYTDGSISLNVQGGKAPFTYVWSNGATTKDISNLAAGWYSVTISDAENNQCILSSEVIEECAMSISYTMEPLKCSDDLTGAIDITVNGGKAPYKYLWDNGAESEDLSGLSAGTYKLTVTDANGCSIQETYILNTPESISAAIIKDVCSPGYLEAVVEGGNSPYSYFWSNGATTKEVEGLTEGNYSVIISDANGCSITEYASLSGSQLPLKIDYSVSKPTCNNLSGGEIALTISGGIAPYTIIWSNGETSKDISNLTAGQYMATVTDSNGCFESVEIDLQAPAQMEIYTTKFSRISCYGNNDGELDIVVTGGSSPYTYLWSNGATTSNIKNLAPGDYEVTVTDATGCKKVSNFHMAQPLQLNAFIINEECNDGSVDLTVSGGTRPYTYLWSNGATTEDLSGLEVGDYTVVITDGRGCTVETEVSIIEVVDPIILSLETSNPKCSDEKGSASVSVSGGSEPYTYNWSNGANTEAISNLSPGNYFVKVTDDIGCFKTLSFSIQSPNPIIISANSSTNISCFGEEDGVLKVNIEGGTLPYTFKWSNGETSKDISGLAPGTYSLLVTDANGCSKSESYNISQPEEMEANIVANLCNNPLLDLTVLGGSKPYQYLWSNGAVTEDISSFEEGMYYVEVTDAKGCIVVAGINVTQPESMDLTFDTTSSGCKCGSNGAVNLTVEGGTGPYTFLWSDGQTTEDLVGLDAGEYSVLVTDAKGCSKTGVVVIEESEPISLELTNSISSSCSSNDGALQIEASGGTGPYLYLWNNGSTTSSISGLAAGNYQVKVTDATGCSADATFTVEQTSGSTSNVSAKFETCYDQVICNGESADINVLYSGTGDWSFTYSDGFRTNTIHTSDNPYILKVSPDKQTTYNLITVSNGCSSGSGTGAVTIGVNDCNSGGKTRSCAINCFDSKTIDIKESGSCTTYTMEVSAGTNCSYALSHFSVAVPCGTVSNISNSRGWKVVIGTDPTTGVSGFKIDDIKGFGDNGEAGVFTIKYTICNAVACETSESSCGPIVAYKAGQCVNYDVANISLRVDESSQISAYPNPSEDGSMTLSLENISGNNITLDIKDMSGIQYYYKTMTLEEGNKTIALDMLKDYPKGIYLLMITSKDKIYTQRIVLK